MKNISKANTFFLVASLFLLLGCGGGGGGGRNSNNNENINSLFYDSSKASIHNLKNTDKIFSAFNGKNSIEIKNIPVDSSGNVLYACLITNPNSEPITSLTFTPPLATKNVRVGLKIDEKEEENRTPLLTIRESSIEDASLNKIFPFRENLAQKAKLKEDLYNDYLKNEADNKSLALRTNINHQDEKEGQSDIIIPVLKSHNGGLRNCTLAKISNYGKFFIDQDEHGSIAAPNISKQSMNQFASEFDKYIYPIIKDYFGNGTDSFWHDVDNDGKLSIVFSPVVNNYGSNVVGIFENATLNDRQYPRDIICVAVNEDDYSKWVTDARETIVHEMQHIVNFSAKSGRREDLWIDEGLSVCSEILYRQKRRKDGLQSYSLYYNGEHLDFAGNDARFYYAEYIMPQLNLTSFSSDDSNSTLAHYGQKGLFFYYLYEQYGKDYLRQLTQGVRGTEKFNVFERSLEELIIDFNFALLNEKIRNVVLNDFAVNPYSLASSKHSFVENMNLNFINSGSGFIETPVSFIEQRFNNLNIERTVDLLKDSNFGRITIPGNGGTIRFFLKQPKNFSNILHTSSYTMTFSSSNPIVINMIRCN